MEVALENNLFVPLFSPPTYVGDLELVVPARACPGGGGGANITGPPVADPVAGVIFINSQSACSTIHLAPASDSPLDGPAQTGTTHSDYSRAIGVEAPPSTETLDGLSIWRGPVGRITAIDMNTGEHLWVIPHGDAPEEQQDLIRNHPLLQGIEDVPTNPGPPRSGRDVDDAYAAPCFRSDQRWYATLVRNRQTDRRACRGCGDTGRFAVRHVELGPRRKTVRHRQLEDGLAAMALR